MYKKYIIALFGAMIIVFWTQCSALKSIWSDNWIKNILTTKDSEIITPPNTEKNIMMEGTHTAVESDESKHIISNISESGNPISTQEEATWATLSMIHRLINRVLWMLAFVALIVVIFWGFQMVTAAWDDAKYKSGKAALKKVSIGIIGIGLSWLIVSLAFRFVDLIS